MIQIQYPCPRDAAGIPYDAAQPPIVMVVMMLDLQPVGVVGRLAGLLCRTGVTEKGASLFGFETISLSNHDVCCVCSMVFFLCDTRLRKWRILHLR